MLPEAALGARAKLVDQILSDEIPSLDNSIPVSERFATSQALDLKREDSIGRLLDRNDSKVMYTSGDFTDQDESKNSPYPLGNLKQLSGDFTSEKRSTLKRKQSLIKYKDGTSFDVGNE